MTHERRLTVEGLARVEGEGGMEVTIQDGKAVSMKLDIYEPPRFFEALLRGRRFTEAPDITSRICGICPIAYQASAVQAMEEACGVNVGPRIEALRRLVYCGEWIESHALHVYLLHAPDFLGYESGIALAQDHPAEVKRGLRIKQVGNRIIEVIGGRSVHPVNLKVGGFHRSLRPEELQELVEDLKWAREAALETVRWVATFNFPDYERDYLFVAMAHPRLYPIIEGRLASSQGLDIAVREYEDHFVEEHVEHSTALPSRIKGGGSYLVGPLARYAINFERLSPLAKEAAAGAGLSRVCRNPFQSIVVRAVEIVYACDEALRLIETYEPPDPAAVEVRPRAAMGTGCTEAPRGISYQRYHIDAAGAIVDAKIVPPTSQNQRAIEEDLGGVVERSLDLPDEVLQMRAEQTIRNYDPCISCATHFLKLDVHRL
jgi:coenzyme F420-reducing hydrogenase alpha subunit